MVEINLNISGTLADFEYASKVYCVTSKVYCVTSKDEEYVLTLVCSVLNRDEKYKKYSVIKDENEKPLYVLNSETGKKIYFKDIKMNLNFTRIDL